MNVIFSLYSQWTNKIFENKKPFEFRKTLPKSLCAGDKLYLYETQKYGGQGAVVGECVVDEIIPMNFQHSPHAPTFRYWAKNIKKDEKLIAAIRKINGFELSNYYRGSIYDYMFTSDIDKIIQEGTIPSHMHDSTYFEAMDRAETLINEYDDWMTYIGFFNGYGLSAYRYAIKISQPIRYDFSVAITNFQNSDGHPITVVPQSFCYTLGMK